jgi:hypothetical protein
MQSRALRRQAVALIAAYGVALQALLSAFALAMPQTMAAPFASFCVQNSSGGASHPLPHEPFCAAVCAALGHGVAGPLPSATVVATSATQDAGALQPTNRWVPPRIAIAGPQPARGPPLA